MKIWLVAIGEPLPSDPGPPRLLRAGILARLQSRAGHEVTWWTGRFAHHMKLMRSPLSADEHRDYETVLLEGRPYASSISLARILNHREQAKDFLRRAAMAPRPDVILCSYPSIELSEAVSGFGQEHDIPVVQDVRDLWPDIFLEIAPAWLRFPARMALASMFSASHRALAGATAITGITDSIVQWGVNRAHRPRSALDRAFPMAYEVNQANFTAVESAKQAWLQAGLTEGSPVVCFFGTLGQWFDIPTVIAAAGLLVDLDVKFVICGDGDRLEEYRSLAAGKPNVLLPGWVDTARIQSLMKLSTAGLAPYVRDQSFMMSLPNKPIEYLAGGLPVLTCLDGELARLIHSERCGLVYGDGNAQELAGAVRYLVANPAARADMAANARRCYEAQFQADLVYANMTDYLAEVVADHGKRRIQGSHLD